MRHDFFQYGGLATAIVLATGLLLTRPAEAQNYAADPHSVLTPQTADGKPDLSGTWNASNGVAQQHKFTKCDPAQKGCFDPSTGNQPFKTDETGNIEQIISYSRRCDPTEKGPDGIEGGCYENTNQQADGEFTNIARISPNRPLYKPEFWDKVQDLDYNTNTKDPIFTCMPRGVPRMGPPAQIVQTAKYAIFFYSGQQSVSDNFRIIPIDGRGHDPVRAKDISYFGDAVGRWDGDTLVVESVGFNDETWLANGGFFHSYDMKVTERLRREGNKLHYQATVEDPTVLLQPWAMNARDLDLDSDPNAYLHEGDQCQSAFDQGLQTNKIRH